MRKKTNKSKTAHGVAVQRMVRRLVRHFQKYRREALVGEKDAVRGKLYKRAIQYDQEARTLQSVINAIKSYKPSNESSSATGAENRGHKT